MAGEIDNKDKKESRELAIALTAIVLILAVAMALLLPAMVEIVTVYLSPGLGLKDSAVISFFVTIIVMTVFAIASGDGLLGEIQYILGSFFVFFIIIWLLLAWVF